MHIPGTENLANNPWFGILLDQGWAHFMIWSFSHLIAYNKSWDQSEDTLFVFQSEKTGRNLIAWNKTH